MNPNRGRQEANSEYLNYYNTCKQEQLHPTNRANRIGHQVTVRTNAFHSSVKTSMSPESYSKNVRKILAREREKQQSPLGRILCLKAFQFYEREMSKSRSKPDPTRKKFQMQRHIKTEIENTYRSPTIPDFGRQGAYNQSLGQQPQDTLQRAPQKASHLNNSFIGLHKTQSQYFPQSLPNSPAATVANPHYLQQTLNNLTENRTLTSQDRRLDNSLRFSCQLRLQSNFSLSDRRSSLSKSSLSFSLKLKSIRMGVSNPMMAETLEKIEIHLAGINYLAKYSDWMDEFYKDQTEWEIAKYLVYRRFSIQRTNVCQALKGQGNCFYLRDLEITELQLKTLRNNYAKMVEFTSTIQEQNLTIVTLTQKMQNILLKKGMAINDHSIQSLYQEINREFRILADLVDKGVSPEEEQIYKDRMVSIMQIVFLIEELDHRYARGFLQCEGLEFKDFMNEAYVDYNNVVTNKRPLGMLSSLTHQVIRRQN